MNSEAEVRHERLLWDSPRKTPLLDRIAKQDAERERWAQETDKTDGPISPFVRRALARELPAKELAR